MHKVLEKFLSALKLHQRPAYRLAQDAGISPVLLSKLINGIETIKPGDRRIVAVGRVLGLSEAECFAFGEPTVEEPR